MAIITIFSVLLVSLGGGGGGGGWWQYVSAQITDLTHTSSISDGVNGFNTLAGARDITTITISESTYALVVSDTDAGIQIIDITTPTNPIPISSVTGGSIFDTLNGANDITTVKIGLSTYALVPSVGDDRIQIIDITNIESPTVVASVSDGDTDVNNNTFDELDGARSITTVQINSSTYALVASLFDDGVQIIDITNPASPMAVSSVTDATTGDGSAFDELDGAIAITTVQMNASAYALVVSRTDDGVQIIDITNPAAPTAVASVSDGDTDVNNNTFNELEGASDITTVRINSSTYALVASEFDDGVQIIDITNPASPMAVSSVTDDDTFDTLDGARGITAVTINTFTYALVVSRTDDGIQIIDITNPAAPTAVASVSDGDTDVNNNTFNELDGARDITIVQIGSNTYALVASFDDDGVQIIRIAENQPDRVATPENPITVSSVTDGGVFNTLDGAGGITTVQIGASTYALVSASSDDGVQIINISNPAAPTVASSITDDVDGFDTLDGPSGITTVQMGLSTYALVASLFDDGVQIIDITDPAAPTAVASVSEGDTDANNNIFDELGRATGITTVQIGASTYALVASRDDNGVQIINITNPASPTAVASVSDGDTDANTNTFDRLAGSTDITTVKIGSSTYALVVANGDSGVQIINITNPASPTAVSSLGTGSTFDALGGATGITTVQIGASTYALVASFIDDGVQIINITNPAAPTAASSITDDVDGFDTLDGSYDITTVKVGASTYALVTSLLDDGVQIINITNPAAPTVASSVSDGDTDVNNNPFDELDRVTGIATFQIDSSIYAIAAGGQDDGIQIIRIAENHPGPVATPENPIPISSVSDGDIFDTLGESYGITTVKIGASTYALVASFADDGVQIINISNPAAPTAVSSVTDGGTFDELDGATDITTVTIGSSTYALVASALDSGIQIIDITDPSSPMPVSSVTDGDTFDELGGAYGITTVQIGASIYALVATLFDDGIQIIDITNPTTPIAVASVSDGDTDVNNNTFDELEGGRDITTVQINSSTYALVASSVDNGIQIIDITNPAAPTAVASVSDGDTDANNNTFDRLAGPTGITTVKIDTSTYALVASSTGNGVQIINITNPAVPTAVSSITDGGTFDQLGGAVGITTVKIGASTYALVASLSDDGIQIINITNPASPTAASSITDGRIFDTLDTSYDITTFQIDSSIYAIVTGNGDGGGIQIIRLTENPPEPEPEPEEPITIGTNIIIGSNTIDEPITEGPNLTVISTMFIRQSNLSTITFNDATVDVFLDDTGKGSLEYTSLIDGTIVTTQNLGSNVIQFTLDPAGPYNDRNPDQAGMPDEDPFQIQNFQSGVHTVIYNKTHFTFNFDDPSFTGLTPAISFQAAIHTAADALTAVDSDLANITINIIDTMVCEITITDSSLEFGIVDVGTTSSEGSIAVQNTGNMDNNAEIGADFWCTAADNGCTGSNGVIFPNRTSFGITQGSSYASKQAFNDFIYDNTSGSPSRNTHPTLPFETLTLFTLTPNQTDTAYLQTLAELIPVDGGSLNRFAGDISQEIILESNCGTS